MSDANHANNHQPRPDAERPALPANGNAEPAQPDEDGQSEERKGGRKPVLDEVKRARVCGMIAMGSSRREAAKAVDCHVTTISRTMERDPDFAGQVRDAEVLARARPLQAMYQAIGTHWRAAAWMLERTRPEEFGRRRPKTYTQRELREIVDRLLAHTLDKIPSEANREYVEEIADQLAQPPDDVIDMPSELQELIRWAGKNTVEFEARDGLPHPGYYSPDAWEEPYDADNDGHTPVPKELLGGDDDEAT